MIRPVTREDGPALAALEVRAWRWAYADIVAEEDLPTVADREARWRERPLDGAWVYELDGRLYGVAEITPVEDEPAAGELHGLYVEPAAQGAGIGTALHDHALQALRDAGRTRAVLWVFTANGHAREFYAHRAWRPDGATKVTLAPELRLVREL